VLFGGRSSKREAQGHQLLRRTRPALLAALRNRRRSRLCRTISPRGLRDFLRLHLRDVARVTRGDGGQKNTDRLHAAPVAM
jgi:hypothetical protein